MLPLSNLAERYATERDIAPATGCWLRYVAGRYSVHLGRIALATDLTDDAVNAWLAALLKENLARRTVRGYRGALVMLWRFAVEIGLLDALPLRLRKIKVPKLIPTACDEGEAARLVAQALGLPGFYQCGVRRSIFWVGLILAIWDSGLRIGDLLRLRKDQVGKDGTGCIVQHKTGWPKVFRFREKAMEAIREVCAATGDSNPLIFGGVISRKTVFVTFRRIADGASFKGGTKLLRKSGATALERQTPGAAMLYLGHQTPGLAYRHYIDPRLLGDGGGSAMPPPLAG